MKAKTFSKILCLIIVVLSFAVLGLFFPTMSQKTVYAETYNNFLSYNGSAHNFKAAVYYPASVTTSYAVDNFQIRLYSTELTWSIFGPRIVGLKFTMTRPDGSTKEIYMKHQGYISDHFEETLFTSDALKDSNGNVIEGQYKVQSSGVINVDLQKDQEQNNSFTFYVNLSAPSVTLQTVGAEISSYDITNKEVTVIANDKDCTPSLTYSRSTNSSYPSSAATSFTSGKTFSDEGNYIVTAKDGGGKTTTKRFAIDKTAPKLTLTGVSNGGYTSNDVTISWDTTVGGVGAQRINSNDSLKVRYTRSTDSTFPTSARTLLSNGEKLSNEGNYFVTIEDSAGNRSSYTFTIDKTAPKLEINGLITQEATKDGFSLKWSTDIGAGKNKANDSDTLTIKYSRATSSYPSSAATTYSKQNTFLSDEGYYYITIEDRTGNRSIYRVIVDQTAPTVKAPTEYLNTSFVYSAEDPRGVTIEYRFNSGEKTELKNTSFTVSFSAENYGVWEFRAIDDVGNTTSWSTVKFFYRDTFGNKVNVQNAYKTPAYWTVQLSSKNFPDISGKYSFAS